MGGERVRGARWMDSGGYMSEIETSDYGRLSVSMWQKAGQMLRVPLLSNIQGTSWRLKVFHLTSLISSLELVELSKAF